MLGKLFSWCFNRFFDRLFSPITSNDVKLSYEEFQINRLQIPQKSIIFDRTQHEIQISASSNYIQILFPFEHLPAWKVNISGLDVHVNLQQISCDELEDLVKLSLVESLLDSKEIDKILDFNDEGIMKVISNFLLNQFSWKWILPKLIENVEIIVENVKVHVNVYNEYFCLDIKRLVVTPYEFMRGFLIHNSTYKSLRIIDADLILMNRSHNQHLHVIQNVNLDFTCYFNFAEPIFDPCRLQNVKVRVNQPQSDNFFLPPKITVTPFIVERIRSLSQEAKRFEIRKIIHRFKTRMEMNEWKKNHYALFVSRFRILKTIKAIFLKIKELALIQPDSPDITMLCHILRIMEKQFPTEILNVCYRVFEDNYKTSRQQNMVLNNYLQVFNRFTRTSLISKYNSSDYPLKIEELKCKERESDNNFESNVKLLTNSWFTTSYFNHLQFLLKGNNGDEIIVETSKILFKLSMVSYIPKKKGSMRTQMLEFKRKNKCIFKLQSLLVFTQTRQIVFNTSRECDQDHALRLSYESCYFPNVPNHSLDRSLVINITKSHLKYSIDNISVLLVIINDLREKISSRNQFFLPNVLRELRRVDLNICLPEISFQSKLSSKEFVEFERLYFYFSLGSIHISHSNPRKYKTQSFPLRILNTSKKYTESFAFSIHDVSCFFRKIHDHQNIDDIPSDDHFHENYILEDCNFTFNIASRVQKKLQVDIEISNLSFWMNVNAIIAFIEIFNDLVSIRNSLSKQMLSDNSNLFTHLIRINLSSPKLSIQLDSSHLYAADALVFLNNPNLTLSNYLIDSENEKNSVFDENQDIHFEDELSIIFHCDTIDFFLNPSETLNSKPFIAIAQDRSEIKWEIHHPLSLVGKYPNPIAFHFTLQKKTLGLTKSFSFLMILEIFILQCQHYELNQIYQALSQIVKSLLICLNFYDRSYPKSGTTSLDTSSSNQSFPLELKFFMKRIILSVSDLDICFVNVDFIAPIFLKSEISRPTYMVHFDLMFIQTRGEKRLLISFSKFQDYHQTKTSDLFPDDESLTDSFLHISYSKSFTIVKVVRKIHIKVFDINEFAATFSYIQLILSRSSSISYSTINNEYSDSMYQLELLIPSTIFESDLSTSNDISCSTLKLEINVNNIRIMFDQDEIHAYLDIKFSLRIKNAWICSIKIPAISFCMPFLLTNPFFDDTHFILNELVLDFVLDPTNSMKHEKDDGRHVNLVRFSNSNPLEDHNRFQHNLIFEKLFVEFRYSTIDKCSLNKQSFYRISIFTIDIYSKQIIFLNFGQLIVSKLSTYQGVSMNTFLRLKDSNQPISINENSPICNKIQIKKTFDFQKNIKLTSFGISIPYIIYLYFNSDIHYFDEVFQHIHAVTRVISFIIDVSRTIKSKNIQIHPQSTNVGSLQMICMSFILNDFTNSDQDFNVSFHQLSIRSVNLRSFNISFQNLICCDSKQLALFYLNYFCFIWNDTGQSIESSFNIGNMFIIIQKSMLQLVKHIFYYVNELSFKIKAFLFSCEKSKVFQIPVILTINVKENILVVFPGQEICLKEDESELIFNALCIDLANLNEKSTSFTFKNHQSACDEVSFDFSLMFNLLIGIMVSEKRILNKNEVEFLKITSLMPILSKSPLQNLIISYKPNLNESHFHIQFLPLCLQFCEQTLSSFILSLKFLSDILHAKNVNEPLQNSYSKPIISLHLDSSLFMYNITHRCKSSENDFPGIALKFNSLDVSCFPITKSSSDETSFHMNAKFLDLEYFCYENKESLEERFRKSMFSDSIRILYGSPLEIEASCSLRIHFIIPTIFADLTQKLLTFSLEAISSFRKIAKQNPSVVSKNEFLQPHLSMEISNILIILAEPKSRDSLFLGISNLKYDFNSHLPENGTISSLSGNLLIHLIPMIEKDALIIFQTEPLSEILKLAGNILETKEIQLDFSRCCDSIERECYNLEIQSQPNIIQYKLDPSKIFLLQHIMRSYSCMAFVEDSDEIFKFNPDNGSNQSEFELNVKLPDHLISFGTYRDEKQSETQWRSLWNLSLSKSFVSIQTKNKATVIRVQSFPQLTFLNLWSISWDILFNYTDPMIVQINLEGFDNESTLKKLSIINETELEMHLSQNFISSFSNIIRLWPETLDEARSSMNYREEPTSIDNLEFLLQIENFIGYDIQFYLDYCSPLQSFSNLDVSPPNYCIAFCNVGINEIKSLSVCHPKCVIKNLSDEINSEDFSIHLKHYKFRIRCQNYQEIPPIVLTPDSTCFRLFKGTPNSHLSNSHTSVIVFQHVSAPPEDSHFSFGRIIIRPHVRFENNLSYPILLKFMHHLDIYPIETNTNKIPEEIGSIILTSHDHVYFPLWASSSWVYFLPCYSDHDLKTDFKPVRLCSYSQLLEINENSQTNLISFDVLFPSDGDSDEKSIFKVWVKREAMGCDLNIDSSDMMMIPRKKMSKCWEYTFSFTPFIRVINNLPTKLTFSLDLTATKDNSPNDTNLKYSCDSFRVLELSTLKTSFQILPNIDKILIKIIASIYEKTFKSSVFISHNWNSLDHVDNIMSLFLANKPSHDVVEYQLMNENSVTDDSIQLFLRAGYPSTLQNSFGNPAPDISPFKLAIFSKYICINYSVLPLEYIWNGDPKITGSVNSFYQNDTSFLDVQDLDSFDLVEHYSPNIFHIDNKSICLIADSKNFKSDTESDIQLRFRIAQSDIVNLWSDKIDLSKVSYNFHIFVQNSESNCIHDLGVFIEKRNTNISSSLFIHILPRYVLINKSTSYRLQGYFFDSLHKDPESSRNSLFLLSPQEVKVCQIPVSIETSELFCAFQPVSVSDSNQFRSLFKLSDPFIISKLGSFHLILIPKSADSKVFSIIFRIDIKCVKSTIIISIYDLPSELSPIYLINNLPNCVRIQHTNLHPSLQNLQDGHIAYPRSQLMYSDQVSNLNDSNEISHEITLRIGESSLKTWLNLQNVSLGKHTEVDLCYCNTSRIIVDMPSNLDAKFVLEAADNDLVIISPLDHSKISQLWHASPSGFIYSLRDCPYHNEDPSSIPVFCQNRFSEYLILGLTDLSGLPLLGSRCEASNIDGLLRVTKLSEVPSLNDEFLISKAELYKGYLWIMRSFPITTHTSGTSSYHLFTQTMPEKCRYLQPQLDPTLRPVVTMMFRSRSINFNNVVIKFISTSKAEDSSSKAFQPCSLRLVTSLPGSGTAKMRASLNGSRYLIELTEVYTFNNLSEHILHHGNQRTFSDTEPQTKFSLSFRTSICITLIDRFSEEFAMIRSSCLDIHLKSILFISPKFEYSESVCTSNHKYDFSIFMRDPCIENRLIYSVSPLVLKCIPKKGLLSRLHDITSGFKCSFLVSFNNVDHSSSNSVSVCSLEDFVLRLSDVVISLEDIFILNLVSYILSISEPLTLQSSIKTHTTLQKRKFVSIHSFRIHKLNVKLSYSSVHTPITNSVKRFKSMLNLPNISVGSVDLNFPEFELKSSSLQAQQKFLESLGWFYLEILKQKIPFLFLSLDALGNPMDFMIHFGRAVDSFAIQGNITKSIFHLTHGITNSLSRITRSMATSLWEFSVVNNSNRTYLYQRQQLINKATSGIAGHVSTGIESFGRGIESGLSDAFNEPIKRASQSGFTGIITGIGHGVSGGVTKVTAGILDLTSSTLAFIRETATMSDRISPNNPSRYLRNSVGIGSFFIPYCSTTAFLQQALWYYNDSDYNERLFWWKDIRSINLQSSQQATDVGEDIRETILVTCQNVWFVSRTLNVMDHAGIVATNSFIEKNIKVFDLIRLSDIISIDCPPAYSSRPATINFSIRTSHYGSKLEDTIAGEIVDHHQGRINQNSSSIQIIFRCDSKNDANQACCVINFIKNWYFYQNESFSCSNFT